MKTLTLMLVSLAAVLPVTDAASAPQQEVAGLVKVEAAVFDEGLNKPVSRTGSGTLVERNGRYFVLTAAHVSVGADAALSVHGEKLEIVKRRVNADNDIEWIEVKQPAATPMAVWQEDCACFVAAASEHMGTIGADVRMPRVPWVSYTGTRTRMRPGVRTDIDGTPNFREQSERMTGRQMLSAKMRPGESGAGLFRKQNGRWVLNGVAQSYDRNFLVSYYAAPMHFIQDMLEFDEQKPDLGTRWRLRNGVTYLDFGNGIREIAPLDPRAGKGGVTDDGGQGGVTDDGGLGNNVFTKLGLVPGIEIDGKPYIAVNLGDGRYAYADRSAIESLRIMAIAPSGKEGHLPTGTKLQSILLERLKKLHGREIKVFESPGRGKDKVSARLEVTEKGVILWLPVGFKDGKPKLLRIALDEYGGVDGKGFLPILRVKDPDGGKPYIVDLRALHFEHMAWASEAQRAIPVVRVKQEGSMLEHYFGFSRIEGQDLMQAAREHCLPIIETLDTETRKLLEDFLARL